MLTFHNVSKNIYQSLANVVQFHPISGPPTTLGRLPKNQPEIKNLTQFHPICIKFNTGITNSKSILNSGPHKTSQRPQSMPPDTLF